MDVVKIKKSDLEECYKLALEEHKILKKYASHSVYKVKITKKFFETVFKSHFGKGCFFYGMKENNKLVAVLSGYIKGAPNGNVGYIDNVFVTKRYRNKGYSTILRNEFFKWLKTKNIKYSQLNVLVRNPAKDIYDKWGFGIDSYQMTKKI